MLLNKLVADQVQVTSDSLERLSGGSGTWLTSYSQWRNAETGQTSYTPSDGYPD